MLLLYYYIATEKLNDHLQQSLIPPPPIRMQMVININFFLTSEEKYSYRGRMERMSDYV